MYIEFSMVKIMLYFVYFLIEKLKTGGICGIPSDTVYILVACCNQPEAVKVGVSYRLL